MCENINLNQPFFLLYHLKLDSIGFVGKKIRFSRFIQSYLLFPIISCVFFSFSSSPTMQLSLTTKFLFEYKKRTFFVFFFLQTETILLAIAVTHLINFPIFYNLLSISMFISRPHTLPRYPIREYVSSV